MTDFDSVSSPHPPGRTVNPRRNKLWMLAGAALVLAMALEFAHLTRTALTIRAATSSEFSQYVLDHGLGHTELAHDSSGFDNEFCILHLNHPVPTDQLAATTLSLLHEYYQLDQGTSLTLVYDQGNGHQVIQADGLYDPRSQQVTLTLNLGEDKRVVHETVQWPRPGA
ncbi:MAG: hypothetical protein K6T26_02165 [Alicyclobacillus sp.]|nr:hypothetical protein [Alicyclobacillus sp.]